MNKTQLDKTLGTIKNYVDKKNYISSRGNITAESGTTYPTQKGLSMTQAYNNSYPISYGNVMTMYGSGVSQLLIGWSGTNGAHEKAYIRSKRDTSDANYSGWAQIYTSAHPQPSVTGSSGSCTGNAATATKLQTARKINGTDFNGTSNITTANWGTARNIQIGNTSKSVNGSGNVSWSLSEIGAAAASHNHSSLNSVNIKGTYILGSYYHYSSGYLIDIGASASQTMVVIHITGNGYSKGRPINSIFQFYDYTKDGGIINASGINLGVALGNMTVYRYNNRLYAWIAQPTDFCTLSFKIYSNSTGLAVPTVSNSAAHSSGYTNLITITPSNISYSDHTHNYLPLTGGTLSGKVGLTTAATSTDASQPTQLAYGLLSSYGNLKIIGNSDDSAGANNEYVHIATAWGLSPAVDKGIVVYGTYANCFGKKISTEGHTHSYITYRDTRDANEKPDDVQQGLSIHLKTSGKDGLSDGGNYHPAIHIKPWGDYSGGPYGQLALTQNQNLWFRTSSSGTAWNAWKKVSLDGHTHNYAASSHNHTSLTGVTRINFAADSSDSAYIGSTVSNGTTSLDFGISDDGGVDIFRWISSVWNPSSESTNTYTAMSLLPGTTSANLCVTGNVNAEKGGYCYAYNADNSKSVSMGVGGGDVFITNSKSGKYLQLKDDGTLGYSDAKVALDGGTIGELTCVNKFTLGNSGAPIIVKITGGAAYEGLKGGGDGICIGDNGTKLYLRHKSQINIENSSYTRKLANITGSGGVDIGDTSCRLSLHSNDNPIFWNGSSGYDVVTMSGMDIDHNKIRYGSGLGGANGYITFTW